MTELTEGKPWARLAVFAAPIALGRLFQSMYSIVDTKIVGLLLGESPLAAVSSVSTLCHLLNVLLDGFALGCSVIMAMYMGSGDRERMKRSFALSILLSLGLAGILTLILGSCLVQILTMLQIPPAEWIMAGKYLRIMILGLIITSANCLLTNGVRSTGNSWTPLLILGVSTVTNIVLDFVLIGELHTGVSGAAAGTIIAQSVSVGIYLVYIYHRVPMLQIAKKHFTRDLRLASELFRSGMAMGLQFCIVNIGTVALQVAINAMGTKIIVAHTAARRFFELMYIPYASLGFAIATYTATNYGAGKIGRIREGYSAALQIMLVWSVAVTAMGEFFPGLLIGYFASSDHSEILLWGSWYLRVEMPALALCGVVVITRNLLQGIGQRSMPLASSILELIIKVVCAWISLQVMGYWGIIISEPLSWVFMSVLLLGATWQCRQELGLRMEKR